MLFSFLDNKMLKHTNSTLYGKTKQHYQKTFILYLLKLVIYQNSMRGTLYGKRKHYQISVFWVFLSFLGTKSPKCLLKHPIWEKKTTLLKTCLLSFFFQFLSYQNSKTHSKHTLLRKIITLPQTCILRVFDLNRYQNVKIYVKHPISPYTLP